MIGTFLLFTVRDVPIRIHFTAFFLLPMIYQPGGSLVFALLFSVMILSSVCLHELGHTVVAQRYGVSVQDIVLTPIGGVARLRGLPENPHHEIRIALAGPYVSLVLAFLGALLTYLSVQILPRALTGYFFYFAVLNTVLLLFNVLPSFPMDGGRVLRGWLSLKKGPLEATRIASSLGKVLSITFIVIGLTIHQTSLAIIGIFILISAGSEYRMVKLKAWQTGGSHASAPLESDFTASPPPYETSSTPKIPSGLAGDFLITAQDLYQEIQKSLRKG